MKIYVKASYRNWNKPFPELSSREKSAGYKMIMSEYEEQGFTKDQLHQIKLGLSDNVDVDIYADPRFDAKQMGQIRMGLIDGVDVEEYMNPKYTWRKMKAIRYWLLYGYDKAIRKWDEAKYYLKDYA